MRVLLIALAAVLFAAPAAAQTDNAQIARASHALSAIWRPVTGPLTEGSIRAACEGAVEEIAAVEAALPNVLTPQSTARVRAPRGLLIIPSGGDPSLAFFIAPAELSWFTSGLGAIAVLDEAQGLIGVREAGGRDIGFQLGRAGQRAVLRIRPPEGALLTFVGCAPIAR
jgi:hypothetical protein